MRSVVVLALAVGALSGCVEVGPELQVDAGNIRGAIAKGQLTSPRAATVALVSLDGVSPDVDDRFRKALVGEAAAREIAMTDAASAHYLVRGYLSAYPNEQGVTVAYTYDVFDAGARRRQARIADTIDVPATGDDPWAAVTAPVLETLVARSADELAVALAGTPEAQAGASKLAATATGAPAATPAPVN